MRAVLSISTWDRWKTNIITMWSWDIATWVFRIQLVASFHGGRRQHVELGTHAGNSYGDLPPTWSTRGKRTVDMQAEFNMRLKDSTCHLWDIQHVDDCDYRLSYLRSTFRTRLSTVSSIRILTVHLSTYGRKPISPSKKISLLVEFNILHIWKATVELLAFYSGLVERNLL